jgi:heme/copper-type cytochrome/quinol oxidase subunit 2
MARTPRHPIASRAAAGIGVAGMAGMIGMLAMALPQRAAACAACFGAADSPMVHGQNQAILFLLGIVALVQVGVVKVIWDFRQRAKRLPPPPTASAVRRLRLIHGGKT